MGKMISETPRTDQKISYCFKRAKIMVTIMTVCLILAIPFWIMVKECLIKGKGLGSLNKNTAIYIISSMTGGSCVVGIIYNIIHLFGLHAAGRCLKKCTDKKTYIFMKGVKKMKWILVLDSILAVVPMAKTITTFIYYMYARKYKKMIKKLESSKKEQQFGIYHEKSLLNKIQN